MTQAPLRLHDQLLAQAKFLVDKDRRRPQGASLRRAVSTAYYALFHLLVDESVRSLARGKGSAKLRLLLARAFTHTEMYKVCKAFGSGGALSQAFEPIYGKNYGTAASDISAELRVVARSFVGLQEGRHEADYAIKLKLKRTEALTYVKQAELAFEAWRRISPKDESRKLFLACLLTYERLKSR